VHTPHLRCARCAETPARPQRRRRGRLAQMAPILPGCRCQGSGKAVPCAPPVRLDSDGASGGRHIFCRLYSPPGAHAPFPAAFPRHRVELIKCKRGKVVPSRRLPTLYDATLAVKRTRPVQRQVRVLSLQLLLCVDAQQTCRHMTRRAQVGSVSASRLCHRCLVLHRAHAHPLCLAELRGTFVS